MKFKARDFHGSNALWNYVDLMPYGITWLLMPH